MQPIEEVPGAPSISNHSTSVKGEAPAWWASHDEALADWCLARHVARKDVHGAYRPDGGQYTAHSPLTRELLIRHFRGEITIGCHSTSTDGRCLSVVADIDAHDGKGADPDVNWRCALAVAEMFGGLDLTALICDSDGKGGYHVRVFFKKSVPVAVAYWLGSRINAGLAAEGLPAVEFFPKQAELTLDCPYGNWLRLPGRHHKRDHWTRIFDHVSGRWLEGEGAVLGLIGIAGDKTTKLLATYKAEQAAKAGAVPVPKKAGASRRHDREEEPGEARVREALDYLPASMADSYGGSRSDTGWLGIGMALHDWDEVRGLPLWHAFSARSPKYEPAVLDDKWTTFTRGGGLTVATIFKAARDGGWKPSDATAKAPVNGRAEPGPSGNGDGRGEEADPYAGATAEELGIIDGDDVELENPDWLWEHRFLRGKINLVAGEGGDGKTTVAILVGSIVTVGGTFPDGKPAGDAGRVLVMAAEDGPGDTLKPRFIAAGGETSNGMLKFLTAHVSIPKKGNTPAMVHPVSLQDIDYWRATFKLLRPKLLIIDPLPAYLGRGINDHKNSEVQALIKDFARVAKEYNVCVIAITHTGKSVERKLIHRILGTVAYTNASRIVHVTIRDPDDRAVRYLERPKCNNDEPRDALVYKLAPVEFVRDGVTYKTTKAVFEANPVAIDAEAMANPKRDGQPRRERDAKKETAAAEWLFDFLDGRPGWAEQRDIFQAAGDAGHIGTFDKVKRRWSSGTKLYRALDRIPSLDPPRAGKRIDRQDMATERDRYPRMCWRLADASDPF